MRIAITGSSGFIGAELGQHFLQRGDQVVMMQRSAPKRLADGAFFLPFNLRSPQLPEPTGLSAMVHCAVMAKSANDQDAEEVNFVATLLLRDFCRKHGISFIFLSTMSAHEDAESVYGRHKFRLERMLDHPMETVLKLGLVVGASGGLFQRIAASIQKSPIIPLVDGGRQPVQTVAVEDVCRIVSKVVDEGLGGKFLIGSTEVISLRELYIRIAAEQDRRLRFISLPYVVFDAVLTVLTLLPVRLPVSKENLLGLKHLRSFDTAADLSLLGVILKPLAEVLTAISQRRAR
jgi:nucleoside-diphosphate-sugar epimerase